MGTRENRRDAGWEKLCAKAAMGWEKLCAKVGDGMGVTGQTVGRGTVGTVTREVVGTVDDGNNRGRARNIT